MCSGRASPRRRHAVRRAELVRGRGRVRVRVRVRV